MGLSLRKGGGVWVGIRGVNFGDRCLGIRDPDNQRSRIANEKEKVGKVCNFILP